MYKLLLSLRYLRTRYIALASVLSVTLGVATMVVVNAVMEGFTTEMRGRIHAVLADVVFESHNLEGFYDPQAHMKRISEVAGEYIAGMTPTVAVPGQLAFEVDGHWHTRHVTIIGVDEATYAEVSDFKPYLQNAENQREFRFDLRDSGYAPATKDAGDETEADRQMAASGWPHRRIEAATRAGQAQAALPENSNAAADAAEIAELPPEAMVYDGWKYLRQRRSVAEENLREAHELAPTVNPFAQADAVHEFDPAVEAHTGLVLGIGLARVDEAGGGAKLLVVPGDDVKISVPTAGTPPKAASDTFTVVDFYASQMSEYDSDFVFVPLAELQRMRGMIHPQSGIGFATSIQIRLRDDAQGPLVRDLLRSEFPPTYYGVVTWQDKQGPLLAAVGMQTAILNVLLFLIIAVAGFGILAIFFMIVVEKTRDIGILKSLGAPRRGILSIFLAYGLSLGVVGSGAGLAIGLVIVANINRIADVLARIMGHDVFDPTIYYFQHIPTIVEPQTILLIVCGAMLIAVSASVLPAVRAARLHPVEALRHE